MSIPEGRDVGTSCRRGRASITLLVAKAEAAQAADTLRRALHPSEAGQEGPEQDAEDGVSAKQEVEGEAAEDACMQEAA